MEWTELCPRFFRCVLASLEEGMSVRRSVRHTRVETMHKCRFRPKLLAVRSRTHLMPCIRPCFFSGRKKDGQTRTEIMSSTQGRRERTHNPGVCLSASLAFVLRERAGLFVFLFHGEAKLPMKMNASYSNAEFVGPIFIYR